MGNKDANYILLFIAFCSIVLALLIGTVSSIICVAIDEQTAELKQQIQQLPCYTNQLELKADTITVLTNFENEKR